MPRKEQDASGRCKSNLSKFHENPRTFGVTTLKTYLANCQDVVEVHASEQRPHRELSIAHENEPESARGKQHTLTSTRPRPKSSPPGNRQTTSMLSPAEPASSLMISPARGAGVSKILDICLTSGRIGKPIQMWRASRWTYRVCDCTSLLNRAQLSVR